MFVSQALFGQISTKKISMAAREAFLTCEHKRSFQEANEDLGGNIRERIRSLSIENGYLNNGPLTQVTAYNFTITIGIYVDVY